MDLDSITLPRYIHATVITDTPATNVPVSAGIVWADRHYRACPSCQQEVNQQPGCPVTMGNAGQMVEWQQQCENCGVWLSILWDECGPDEAAITGAAKDLRARRAAALAAECDRITGTLTAQLSAAMARLAEPLAEGETTDDRADEITTGRDDLPGIYYDGQWLAWDFQPDDNGELITVFAADLR